MGIVNVTPDSFSDGGCYLQQQAAIAHARQLIEQGADMIDIGGESTRPGAKSIGIQQELDRVMPVIEGLLPYDIALSLDTSKPEVMRQGLAAGVDMINDVNALQAEGAIAALSSSNAGLCLMHKQGVPATMQQSPSYTEVMDEVAGYLQQRIAALEGASIVRERICIDPGFGFGKTLSHNVAMLARFNEFQRLGVALLAGISRKSMLGELTGRPVDQRMAASVAAAMIAVQRGANIVRVHDVAQTVDALKLWQVVNNNQGVGEK